MESRKEAYRLFPILYDLFLTPCEWLILQRWRERLLARVRGEVLEIGAGTGLNLPHYRQVSRLVVTDPDTGMLARAQTRAAAASCPVEFVVADGAALPFVAETFDAVVATLAFCTIPRPEAALEEIHRVLKPGAALWMLEHVRSRRSWIARLQDTFTPLWKHLANGCHLNRRPLDAARACGFTPVAVREGLDGWLIAAELLKPRA